MLAECSHCLDSREVEMDKLLSTKLHAPRLSTKDCSCLSAPWKTPNLQCLSLFYPSQSLINGKAQFPKVFVDSKQEND